MAHTFSLSKGTWIVGDCGKHSSEIDCKMVFIAPENQRDELLNTIIHHAVHRHNNQDTPQLRVEVEKALEKVKV